jgi:hypothetical protein
MKIFVKDYDFKSLPIVYTQKNRIQRFITLDGIYEFHKDGFYEIQYKELKRDVRKLKHLEFLIEDVRVCRTNKTYHIPFDHFFVEETREEVIISSGITLVKETYGAKEDYYFETEEDTAKACIQLFGILV